WIEGIYVELVRDREVVFTWGGIEGLRPGQSSVKFTLRANSRGTLVRLRHSSLTDSAAHTHHFGWRTLGLPKLKAVTDQPPQYICSAYGSVAAGWLAVACLAPLMLVLIAATIYAPYLCGRQAAPAR